jgi:hypothetical protein
LLVALLLPAIQAARESARKSQCCNHLKQIALATHSHVSTIGHFPSGGWGASWTGDPDRGFGARQPGGWVYNLLPFLELESLHEEGAGLPEELKRQAASRVMQQPLELFHCPTRRPATPYPNTGPYRQANASPADFVARGDYAMNAGDRLYNSITVDNMGGPATLIEGDTTYAWRSNAGFTGVSFLRSEARIAQVIDGTSHTYLAGEKYLDTEHYDDPTDTVESDRGHLHIGCAPDTIRLAKTFLPPRQDSDYVDYLRFGSAHVDVCHFAFCDGSVRAVAYSIEPELHRSQGNRQDEG